MTVLLCLFAITVVLELAVDFLPLFWRERKVLGSICVLLTAFTSGAIALWQLNVFSVLLGVIGLYRILNYLRLAEGRMHEAYLRRAFRRSGLVLLLVQAAVAALWWGYHVLQPETRIIWSGVAVAQLAVAAVFLASAARRINHTRWPARVERLSDSQMPTVSVCIPARNETEDLEACLASLISCDYPKLEILVLDDCSQNQRTPEIIRSFAHDGVRFIQGAEPSETWLAKNQAYNRLVQEASGQVLLFCGVDMRFGQDSIAQMVSLMAHKKKSMLCVLPWRNSAAGRSFAPVQAMRYAWELVPPRRLFNRPPVLSTCWVITKDALRSSGGFEAVTRSIVPEALFARRLSKTDEYSFMRAGREAGLISTKSLQEQRNTAIRMRYPQLHRRPENVLLLTAFNLGVLLLPFGIAIGGFWWPFGIVAQSIAGLVCVLLVVTFGITSDVTRTAVWWLNPLAIVFGVGYDVALLHASLWQYEFFTVEWKGRNVCVPAMHVVPHLPPME